ncbi:hypothetical protein C8R44DRAFT_228670 [Mycena epipterygia]|nr:hypothetical protein C8R44DRAFT_228670 [Mycena epipterygia]
MPPKKFKLKEYRVPRNSHFLFLKDPWPFGQSASTAENPQAYFNAVVGWLCCMISDLCQVDIHRTQVSLFWQSTHQNLIVEIEVPPTADVPNPSLDPVLGAHHSRAFLTEGAAGPENQTCIIYEYNYERFNSPQKTNWDIATATYPSLHPDFPIKHGGPAHPTYPAPSPTDAKKMPFTKTLPGRLIWGHPDCIQQTAAPPSDPLPGLASDPLEPPPGYASPSSQPVAEERISPTLKLPPESPPRAPSPPPQSPAPRPEPTNPMSEFAFTPYERPLHFPRGHTATPSASTSQKRDPYEEGRCARVPPGRAYRRYGRG